MTIQEAEALIAHPIAYHRIFARIGGGATAGLMLSQAWYWSSRTREGDGWFWKTEKEWEEETGLTRYEQEGARRLLRRAGLIEEKKKGMPSKLYFRVNKLAVLKAISAASNTGCGKPANKDVENQQTSMRKTSKQACGKTTCY